MKKSIIRLCSALTVLLLMSFCTINVMAVEKTNEKKVSTIELSVIALLKMTQQKIQLNVVQVRHFQLQ